MAVFLDKKAWELSSDKRPRRFHIAEQHQPEPAPAEQTAGLYAMRPGATAGGLTKKRGFQETGRS